MQEKWPTIIQGGMGVGVSSPRLAREVAMAGELGVVSGTGLNTTFIRRLQLGDADGVLRRAVAEFPVAHVAQRFWNQYFVPGGKSPNTPFKRAPMATVDSSKSLQQLTALATFVEVYLAKEGHAGTIGINFLEKIHLSNLAGIYGAMLAGVDYVLMGAGIPREIPGVLDAFSMQHSARIRVPVHGASADQECYSTFEPEALFPELKDRALKRPRFFAIISSVTLASHLLKKSTGRVDGFVVEGPTAGGHNAPPRGSLKLDERGEPIYGEKDSVDLAKIRELGLPFWLAGNYGTPEGLRSARAAGAVGIQVGTAFAFAEESGLTDELKSKVLSRKRDRIITDPQASPTGFPFKVVPLAGTLSDPVLRSLRPRKCDLGYLRQTYLRPDGSFGYRCPGEPIEDFVKKGGTLQETEGKVCLCNSLVANLGLGQRQESGYEEQAFLTAGEGIDVLDVLAPEGRPSYKAIDVLNYLKS